MSDTYTSRPGSKNLGGNDQTGQGTGQAKDLAGQAKDLARDVKAKASGLTDEVTRAAKDNASQLGNAAAESS